MAVFAQNCKLSGIVSCVHMAVCWRSVLPTIFVTVSLTVHCLSSASDVVVVSGARATSLLVQQCPQGTESVRPRLYSERHEDPRKDWNALPAMLPKASLLVT